MQRRNRNNKISSRLFLLLLLLLLGSVAPQPAQDVPPEDEQENNVCNSRQTDNNSDDEHSCRARVEQDQPTKETNAIINNIDVIHELDVYNFERVLLSSSTTTDDTSCWTVLLCYDPLDVQDAQWKQRILQQLLALQQQRDIHTRSQEEQENKEPPPPPPLVRFATLDMRRHSALRPTYCPHQQQQQQPLEEYYGWDKWSKPEPGGVQIHSQTFLTEHLPHYWQSVLVLVSGHNGNVYAQYPSLYPHSNPQVQLQLIHTWITQHATTAARSQPPISTLPTFRESKLARERDTWTEQDHQRHVDFDWEDLDKLLQQLSQLPTTKMDDRDDTDTTSAAACDNQWDDNKCRRYKHREQCDADPVGMARYCRRTCGYCSRRRLLDEREANQWFMTGTQNYTLAFDPASNNLDGTPYFQYEQAIFVLQKPAAKAMNEWGRILAVYHVWTNAYHDAWSNGDRQDRVNTATNYHQAVAKLNQQLSRMLQAAFASQRRPLPGATAQLGDIHVPEYGPGLQAYVERVVLGYGRSPRSMETCLQQPECFHDFVARIRDFWEAWEDNWVGNNQINYATFYENIRVQWHAILGHFHRMISKHYYNTHRHVHNASQEEGALFATHLVDVLDMANPQQHGNVLSNYTEFERQYTIPGIPVVLGNAQHNISQQPLSLEYFVQTCGGMDVTDHVYLSPRIGRPSSLERAGLTPYVLDWELLTYARIPQPREENDPGEVVYVTDYDLTLEQYVVVSQRLATMDGGINGTQLLLLDQVPLLGRCERVLYDRSVYDAQQRFRIPVALGAYDWLQRLTLVTSQGRQQMSPSLSMGPQGSNRKLQVEDAAMGYWMYLVSGRQRWVIYHADDRPFLYERMERKSFVPDVLGMNRNQSNAYFDRTFPLLRMAERRYEVVQEPGQIVVIPPNTPYAVELMEDSVALGFHYVPRVGVMAYLHDLIHQENAWVDVELILKYWLSNNGDENANTPAPSKDPLFMTFSEFKSQQ